MIIFFKRRAMPSIRFLARRVAAGFSLVETVLAMAVMSLAITVLLGLLPHGLEMSRKAGISAGEARVTGDVLAELSRVAWTDLQKYDGRMFYFDDQGVRMENFSEPVSYVARAKVPTGLKLPGASEDADALRRVVVQVASTANRNFAFDENQAFSTYTSIISRTK